MTVLVAIALGALVLGIGTLGAALVATLAEGRHERARLISALIAKNATELARIDSAQLAAERLAETALAPRTAPEGPHVRAADDQRFDYLGMGGR